MAPNAALVHDPPTSRWLRRSAPFWILLGIALLTALPGLLTGAKDLDSASEDVRARPISQFASSQDADPRARRMTEGRAGR